MDDLIEVFEEAYGKVFARSARSPELGYLVTHAIVLGSVEVERPALPDDRESAGAPPTKATRQVWWQRPGSSEAAPATSDVYELSDVACRPRDRGAGDRRVGRDHLRDPAGPHGAARPPPDLPPQRLAG